MDTGNFIDTLLKNKLIIPDRTINPQKLPRCKVFLFIF